MYGRATGGWAVESRGGVRLFPRVLVQCLGLEGEASHLLSGGRRIHIGMEALPQRLERLP